MESSLLKIAHENSSTNKRENNRDIMTILRKEMTGETCVNTKVNVSIPTKMVRVDGYHHKKNVILRPNGEHLNGVVM